MDNIRYNGITALSSVLKIEQNINILEKYIYKISKQEENKTDFEEVYNDYIYEIIGDILNKKKIKDILKDIKNNKIGWNSTFFDLDQKKIEEQDEFIENPFDIEEGVLECRCGSKRVFSYSKQVRSADEPTTTYAQCMACKAKWSYSG